MKPIIVEKQTHIKEISKWIDESKSFVIFEYHGLTATEMAGLRNALHSSNSKLFVLKNNITKRALNKSSIKDFDKLLKGPNAIAFAKDDEIAAIKAVAEIAKNHDFVTIKGGYLEKKFIDADKVKELSSIPGRDGLYSMLLSCFTAPIRNFLYGVKAVAEQK